MDRQTELERIQLIVESQNYFKGVRHYHSLNYLEEVCGADVPELRYRKSEFRRINENEIKTLNFIVNYEGANGFPDSVKENFIRSLAVMSGFNDF